MKNLLISWTLACAALLPAVLATATPSKNAYCMMMLNDEEKKNSNTPSTAKYVWSDLKNLGIEPCDNPKDKCVECLPVRDEMQGYVSLCSSKVQRNDTRYSCSSHLLEPCERDKMPCAVDYEKLIKSELPGRTLCSYFYKVQESVKYSDHVFCTGFCAVGTIFIDRQYHISGGCSKPIREWLRKLAIRHPGSPSKFCENATREEDCSMPVRFLLNGNYTNATSDVPRTGRIRIKSAVGVVGTVDQTVEQQKKQATTIDESPKTDVVVNPEGQTVAGGGGDTTSTSVIDAPTPPPPPPPPKKPADMKAKQAKTSASGTKGAEGAARVSAGLTAAGVLAALLVLRLLRLS